MQKLVIGMPIRRKPYGFTLIELLIVVVIITITINFAMLAFNDFGEKNRIVSYAENFGYILDMVKKESILTDQTMSILVKKNEYDILKLENNKWKSSKNIIYKNHKLPSNASMSLLTNSKKAKNSLIIINAAGKITPFVLNFYKGQDKLIVTILCDSSGNIKIKNNEK